MLAILVLCGYLAGGFALLLPASAKRIAGAAAALVALGIALGLAMMFSPDAEARVQTVRWVPALELSVALRLDGLSFFFAMLITIVGAGVMLYAGGYTRHWERGRNRLFALLFFFMASMLGLVLADNLFLLYVFWELTTIASFLLIGFKSAKKAARKAAFVALLVTGGGGLLLLAGLLILGASAGTYSLGEIVAAGTLQDQQAANWAVAFIGAGALIKSGQFPFHYWLPRAMEAPTPASAYLHAATMVKAGLYLLARLLPVLGEASLWAPLLASVAIVTAGVAIWGMLAESDAKACLAYSTIGALSVGVACLAVGGPKAMEVFALFLLAHAGYKACLFMVVGGVEEATGTRDLRALRGYGKKLPGLAFAAVGGAIAMAEIGPELSYMAKEAALAVFRESSDWWGVAIFATLATAFVALALLIGYRAFFARPTEERALEAQVPPSLWVAAATLGWLGAVLALLPEWTSHWLVDPVVASAVPASEYKTHLSLWHGWTWELGVTIATLLVGVFVSSIWMRILAVLSRGNGWALRGTDRLFESLATAWLWFSRRQSEALEHGRLPLYLMASVLALALIALPWGWEESVSFAMGEAGSLGFDWMDVFLAALAVTGLVVTIIKETRSAIVFGLALIGLALAVVYARFGAPDVAITHILIETLMVALLAGALRELPSIKTLPSRVLNLGKFIAAASCGLALTLALVTATRIGDGSRVSGFYIETVAEQKHRSNVVAVIIADFRAIDTLGEITVLATAAIGVFHLARSARRKGRSL